jgi:NADH-quinone oxidoreductase subunit E
MLTVEEHEAIAELVSHYPAARAACIDAMKYLQARRRWISDPLLRELAGVLGMSNAELDEVATFYNLIFRKPVGEKVILLCDSITCWMLGRERLAARIAARLGIAAGETTADEKFTLLPIVCLGACDHAPVMMIGDTLYGDVDEKLLDELLTAELA